MTGLGLGLGFSRVQASSAFNPALKKYNGSKSMSFAAQDTTILGLAFRRTNGTRMIISGAVGDDLYPYDGVAKTITGMTLNANNIVFTVSGAIAAGSVVQFWPVWGNGTWNETNIVRDNNGLPLITTASITATEA